MESGETAGDAITALVFAVIGWVVLPVVGPVLALVYAGRARRQMRDDPYLRGDGLVTAARTVSIVQLVLLLFAAVAGFAIALVATSRSDQASVTPRRVVVPTSLAAAPDGVPAGLVSSSALVPLVKSLPPPAVRLDRTFSVASLGDYRWADGGPEHVAGTLRLNLQPRPPHDGTLVRLMIFDTPRDALHSLSQAAGNFGADNLGQDPRVGRPAACWDQQGTVCDLLVGRILVDAHSPNQSSDALHLGLAVARWLNNRIPLEDTLTATP